MDAAQERERANVTGILDLTPEEIQFNRAVQIRLAHFGPNPTADIVERVQAAVTAQLQGRGAAAADVPHHNVGRKKVPFAAFKTFVESEEEIDGFLADFERQCTLHRVPTDEWVTILSGKLSGRASDAFRAIPEEDIIDYQAVKDALLARYAVTPEVYRRRFRETPKHTEQQPTGWQDAKLYLGRRSYKCLCWNIASTSYLPGSENGSGTVNPPLSRKPLDWQMNILTLVS